MLKPIVVGISLIALSMAAGLAGCGNSQPTELLKTSTGAKDVPVAAEWIDGRLEIEVPVPVITIGLSSAEAAALADELPSHTVNHSTGDFNQIISTDIEEPQEQGANALLPLMGETFPHPVLPTAVYEVKAAPDAMVEEFKQALAAAKISGDRYDALTMEDWLAEALPKYGFGLNPNAPSMVVIHLDAFGAGAHGWKVQGDTGFLEPVRLFGDRNPFLVLDPSAVEDPYGGSGGYKSPVTSDNAGAIATFVRELTEYRVLQASIYPVAQASCHAVTAVVGVKAASLSQLPVGILRPFEDAFRAEVIKASFDHLTGSDVFFDVKILSLPVDDPPLDAISRLEFPGYEVMRGYLDARWDNYHVDHPGCEEYLSVLFIGDAAGVPGGGVTGIGTYDDNPGRRVSMSYIHDAFRFLLDPESPGCAAVGAQVFGESYCVGKDYLNWWEYHLSHETGHILGQRHPHDVDSSSSSSSSNNSFSSVWSSMSYQQDGRMIDFGANDHANWQRNRAGFALMIASEAGHEGTPAWNAAMDAARQLDWKGAWQSLQE